MVNRFSPNRSCALYSNALFARDLSLSLSSLSLLSIRLRAGTISSANYRAFEMLNVLAGDPLFDGRSMSGIDRTVVFS